MFRCFIVNALILRFVGSAGLSSFATALLFVGFLLYHESLTWNKAVGVVICLIGLVFINLK